MDVKMDERIGHDKQILRALTVGAETKKPMPLREAVTEKSLGNRIPAMIVAPQTRPLLARRKEIAASGTVTRPSGPR